MASGSFNLESDISTLQGKIVWSSSSNGSAANSSTVTGTLYVARTDNYTTTGNWEYGFNIGGNIQSGTIHASVSSSWVAVKSITNSSVSHNDDGTGSCFIEGYCIGPDGTSMAGHSVSGSRTVTLDTIPRYPTANQSLNSKTINSIKINWSSDSTISEVKYSTNNGSSWSSAITVNAKSGTYTISSLNPNTTYNIKTRLKRKDSQLTKDTTTLAVTTYQIATLTNVPNVNIGASQTITWANPGSSTTTLKLCKTDNTQIINYGTVTGTSKTVTPTASTIYALTPDSNTYKARYILTTTANGTSYTNSKDFTFTVTNSNPTFSNYTFKNTNTTTYNGSKKLDDLTGSDQILVKGFSNVQITVTDANKAVAKNSATMKNYSLTIGSKSATNSTLTYPLTMSVNKVDSSSIVVAAVDSRGNSTKVTKSATYKSYSDLVISGVTATRSDNGVGETVTIKFNGTFWNSSFGSISNTIVSATYKYKKTTSSTWSSSTAVTPTISSGNYNATVTPNVEFDVASSYNISITVKDYLETKTMEITLGSGSPALAIYKNNLAIGQKYDTNVSAKLQVNGAINIPYSDSNGAYKVNGNLVLRQNSGGNTLLIGNGNTMYLRPNGSSSTTGEVKIDTAGNVTASKFTGELSGNATSATSATNATNANNTEIDTTNPTSGTWYYPTWTTGTSGNQRHRVNNGFRHYSLEGTTSANGRSIIQAGNGTASGTAGNKRGEIWIYGTNTGVAELLYGNSTANPQIYMPTHGGSLQSRSNLYNNDSGTTGNVTLSETAANFDALEITFKDSTNNRYGYNKIYSPNGKGFNLQYAEFGTGTGAAVLFGRSYSISGTTITATNNYGFMGLADSNATHENRFQILRVDGIKG